MNCPYCKTKLEDTVLVEGDDGGELVKFSCDECGNKGYIGLPERVET